MKDRLKQLAEQHPVPHETKLDIYVRRLERMAMFYTEKREVAPTKQAMLFLGFINALIWSAETVRKYRSLTKEIKRLSE